MKSAEYIDVLSQNYFNRYLPAGGSAFKLVVTPSAATSSTFHRSIADFARNAGAVAFSLSSSEHKLHLMDQLYFGISKAIEWDSEAMKFVSTCILPNLVDQSKVAALDELSRKANIGLGSLKTQVSSAIKQHISQDYNYSAEFRVALAHLALGRIVNEKVPMSPFSQLVQEWLRGSLQSIVPLKEALIFRKVQRSSARHMLYSTLRFLRKCGYKYVVIVLDIARYLESVKFSDRKSGFYYSPAATLDLYEMMRQSIDDVHQVDGTMMIVTVPFGFVSDQRRGLERYQALKMRLWSDVRLRNVQNPMAPMIRLS